MKVTVPDDLQGRLINCQQRARMLAFSLEAMAAAADDIGEPDDVTLRGMAAAADELFDELNAIDAERVAQANARGAR